MDVRTSVEIGPIVYVKLLALSFILREDETVYLAGNLELSLDI